MAKIFKKPRTSTVIFYSLVLVVLLAFYLLMSSLMGKLKIHLERYQAAHINTQYRLVFQQYFADPDWAALYEEAGMEDTEFEDAQAYAAYMQAKVGDQELICFLESNGTSGKKCPVYLGDEEIGVFYMTAPADTQPETEPWYYQIPFAKSLVNKLKIQSWQYDGMRLVAPKRELSVTVTTEDHRIIYVNGVALGQAQLVSTTHTIIDDYLPDGLQGARRQTFYQDGFLIKPVVTVTDLEGNPIEMVEAAPGQYTEVFTSQESEPELEAFITKAAAAYCKFATRDGTIAEINKYYDRSSQLYHDILELDVWAMTDPSSTRMGETKISHFYRYSEDIVTAHVQTVLHAKLSNGTEMERPLDATFFMKKTETGEYLVYNMIYKDVNQTQTLVRLRFFADGQLLESRMVDATVSQLQLPAVTAPEGKTFSGWYTATEDAGGNQTLSLVFMPKDGENSVFIPADTDLSPMDLQARFE